MRSGLPCEGCGSHSCICSDKYPVTAGGALTYLLHLHYDIFMKNQRFWYEKHLQAADMHVCVAASELRKELAC
jgi:hypothetical protein